MKDLYALFRFSLAGLRVMILATLVVGLAYPILITGIGKVALPWRSEGSLVTSTGAHTTDPSKAVGSALLGQVVAGQKLFLPRPSDAGDGYDPEATAASNRGPNDPLLVKLIARRQATVAKREGVPVSEVPPDAVTASASGLDPDISPAYAAIQVPRVARETGLSVAVVQGLVADATHGRTWGILGEAHVNVLLLDIAVMDAAKTS